MLPSLLPHGKAVKVSDGEGSGAEQEYLLLKAKIKHDQMWSPNRWLIVMCEASHLLRFLQSPILCRLQKSFNETINRGPLCAYTYKKIIYTHVKDPVVHVRVWWIMETSK